MKKFAITATALAIGALLSGAATAAATTSVDLADASTAPKFAKELSYVSDANSITPTGGNAHLLNFTT